MLPAAASSFSKIIFAAKVSQPQCDSLKHGLNGFNQSKSSDHHQNTLDEPLCHLTWLIGSPAIHGQPPCSGI